VINVSRASVTDTDFASTLTVSGAVAYFSDMATATQGTITSTADVVQIKQGYSSNTGAALSIDSASNIDALFAPLPRPETPGRVWLWMGGQLKSVRVRLGVSDGQYTELISEEIQPDMDVMTGILISNGNASRLGGQTTGTSNPLMPQRGGPGGGRGR